MNKVSVVLFYWIAVAAALLFAKTAGLAGNDSAIIKIVILVTIFYVGITLITFSRARKMTVNQNSETKQYHNAKSVKKGNGKRS